MKALYYEKPLRENASIREMPNPVCQSHDIIIKVMSCSICHGVEADHEVPGGSGCSTWWGEFCSSVCCSQLLCWH